MRWLLVLMLTASAAHADGDRFALAGLGTSIVEQAPGWVFRIESRIDTTRTDEDEPSGVTGGHVGIDAWSANSRWGFSMPLGWYAGAQAKSMRTTIGGGLGMFALEGGRDFTGGIAPFANATLEKTAGELMIVLEARLARQVIVEQPDHNIYSVMLMAGRRFDR